MTFSSALGRDHPRVCGEKFDMLPLEIRQKGSPPRMRGKGPVNRRTGKKPGITPACAGKSLRLPSPAGWAEDHPRMCGEKPLKVWLASSIPGSPPRMRGKAGQLGVVLIGQGSPPRMRGKVHKEVGNKLRLGITPACAGKRAQRPLPAQTCGDHPRMCGEKIRSFTCGSACRSGRIMPGISSISVSSAHDGHQPKAVGLAASHALTQQCPELL